MQELSKSVKDMAASLIPNPSQSVVAVGAPGEGEGFWAGASSAVNVDGVTYLAYRLRGPLGQGRGFGTAVAKSRDGVHFETIALISKESMDAESLERPALVVTPDHTWRLYLSCATTGTKHWRVELLEADDPASFDPATRRVIAAGDDKWGVKDPVIAWHDGHWHMWATFHPLDEADEEDRMETRYAVSKNGTDWSWHGTAMEARPGKWDSRGARVTAVRFTPAGVLAFYDGRAGKSQNFEERTGLAFGTEPALLVSGSEKPVGEAEDHKALRYLDMVNETPNRIRLYYEFHLENGSHELRTETKEFSV